MPAGSEGWRESIVPPIPYPVEPPYRQLAGLASTRPDELEIWFSAPRPDYADKLDARLDAGVGHPVARGGPGVARAEEAITSGRSYSARAVAFTHAPQVARAARFGAFSPGCFHIEAG